MTSVPLEVLIEAKRRVSSLARRGKLLSPRQAWLLSGDTRDSQTLWSISFQLGMETDQSAEDINQFLENQFPQYTAAAENHHWDDHHSSDYDSS